MAALGDIMKKLIPAQNSRFCFSFAKDPNILHGFGFGVILQFSVNI